MSVIDSDIQIYDVESQMLTFRLMFRLLLITLRRRNSRQSRQTMEPNSSTAGKMSPAVFKTFTSDTQLAGRLCSLRDLSGGKYELVQLGDIQSDGELAFLGKDIQNVTGRLQSFNAASATFPNITRSFDVAVMFDLLHLSPTW